MARENISLREKIFLILESLFILLFFLLTCLELYAVFKMYSTYITSQSLYYFFLIHNRLQMKYFNAYIIGRNPRNPCPYCPPDEIGNGFRIAYLPRQILAIGTIKQARPIDITDSTQVYDYFATKIIQNNTQAKKKYFSFDLQETGTATINLMTNYIFNIWKGIHICAVQFFYNDPRAYLLIPVPKEPDGPNKNRHCKQWTGDPGAQSCGIYFDTYMTCSLKRYTSMNNSLKGNDFESEHWDQWDAGWTCPFNYFDMNFTYNPNYNFSDPINMKIDASEYMQFLNTADVNSYPGLANKFDFYKTIENKYLLYDLDNAFVGNYTIIQNANDTLNFASEDATTYTIGQPYAFKDSFNGIWDTYTFVEFFNDTYYKEPIINSKTGKTTYLPEFLKGPDEFTYYLPIDKSANKINVSLTYWGQPTVTKECFDQYINPQKKYDWLVQLSLLQTLFLDDSLPLLLAWLFVKLFISFFWQFSIRFKLIYEKLSRGYNFPADIKSDYSTRYTTKLVGVIMFALLFNGLLYQENYFKNIIDFCKYLLTYNCYSDPQIKESIKEYSAFASRLMQSNGIFLLSLSFSLAFEIIVTIMYTIDYYFYKKKEQEELLTKKEN